jgi:hypothetical protein
MKKTNLIVCGISLILAISPAILGQADPTVTPEMRKDANIVFQAQDWEKAANAYKKIVEIETENGPANYRLGFSLLNQKMHSEAQKYLEKAFTISPSANTVVALARVLACQGNKTRGFEVLSKAASLPGVTPEMLTTASEFVAWKDEAQFKAIVKELDIATYPCKTRAESRQFDFWLGEWDVKTPQGQLAGRSLIQTMVADCVVFENWSATSGSNGKSMNVYSQTDKKWHQTWIDEKGTLTNYVGGFADGKMVLVADTVVDGKKTLSKMTFSKLPGGEVRQFGENSTDDGKSWVTSFELIYFRKK